MKPTLKPRLSVESLEGRETPSVSLTFSGGTLSIRGDNLPNAVDITEAAGAVTVKANAATLGTFAASNLSITMGNSNDTVTMNMATGLPGTLNVSLGNGNDTIDTTGTTAGAKIGGNATINTGLGGNPAGTNSALVRLVNLSFNGTITNVIGPAAAGSELLDTRNNNFPGTLLVSNFYATILGDATGPTNVGTLVVNNSLKNTDGLVAPPNGPGNLFNLIAGSKVAGNFTYTGGPGLDDVGIFGPTATPSTVAGNVVVNGRSGRNTLFLGGISGTEPGNVNGDVSLIGSSGIDRFLLDNESVVGGNVNLQLFDGANEVLLGSLGGFTVGGSLSVNSGNGDLTLAAPTSPSTVSGNLAITLGNGANDVTIDDNLFVGGNLDVRAGSGDNTVTFSNTTYTGPLRITLGGGSSTVDMAAIADYMGSATIDFGVGFGTKTFNPPGLVSGSLVLLNYP